MSTAPREILLIVQEDCYQRVLASAWLADVAVILERKEHTAAEIKALLSARTARGGKIGACILVQRPLVTPEGDNTTGRAQLVQAFTVIEHPQLNAGDIGTGKSAEEIAVELFDLFQGAAASRPKQVFSALPGGAIVPDDSFPGFNAWEVRMRTNVGLRRTTRLGLPIITPDEGAAPQLVTLDGTPGATVRYTLDGTAPYSGNPDAIVYTVPFNVPTAATVRAAQEQANFQPSGIAEAAFT
jgi:hypothetical protein